MENNTPIGFDTLPEWYFSVVRFFGSLWLERGTRQMSRIGQSRAIYRTALLSCAAFMVASSLALIFEQFFTAWALSILTLVSFALVNSRGTVAFVETSQQQLSPADALAAARSMLESAGFGIPAELSGGGIRAIRQASGSSVVEKEWRGFPLQLRVATRVAGDVTMLTVEGTAPAGAGAGREALVRTCEAIATLDGKALAAVDKTILLRQSGLALGGLGGRVNNVIFLMTLTTAGITAALFALAWSRTLDMVSNHELREHSDMLRGQLVAAVNAPQERTMGLVLSGLDEVDGRFSLKPEVLEQLRATGFKGEVVVAMLRENQAIDVVHPAHGHPLHSHITRDWALESHDGINRLGDRLFVTGAESLSADREVLSEKLARGKKGRLIYGTALTLEEFALFVPELTKALGITFFANGKTVVDVQWKLDLRAKAVRSSVSQPNLRIPEAVLRHQFEESDLSRDVQLAKLIFLGGIDRADNIHEEQRGDHFVRVEYQGGSREGAGWSGTATTYNPAEFRWFSSWVGESALQMLAFVGLIVLAMTMLASVAISRRISKPLIEARDGLRAIAEGDFSLRLIPQSSDELGQLQQLLNHAAAELQKRDAIRDLMGKYLSKQVADKILEGDEADSLTGVRKEVTVLFADVRGFTTYSESHDPEQVTNSLNEYFEIMVEIIASHDGVLDKYIGDGLMVVFGAPVSQPDHARRAVDTALEMQAAIKTLNLKRAQRGDVPIDIGIGINTGLAISGNLGSIKRMEFTVIGDTVNTAARLESRAEKGQILIGKGTYEKVTELVEVEPMGEISVKGKSIPVEVWGLKALKLRRA